MSTKVSSPAWSQDPVWLPKKQQVVEQSLHVRYREGHIDVTSTDAHSQ